MSTSTTVPERLLSASQSAELATVSVRTIQRYAERGILPHRRTPTGALRLRRADVEALLSPLTPTAS